MRLQRKIQSQYRWWRHRSVQILFSLKIAASGLLFISDLAAKPQSRIAPLRELLGSTLATTADAPAEFSAWRSPAFS